MEKILAAIETQRPNADRIDPEAANDEAASELSGVVAGVFRNLGKSAVWAPAGTMTFSLGQ